MKSLAIVTLLCLGAPFFAWGRQPFQVIASSEEPGHAVANAFRRDGTNYWQPRGNQPAWLEFRFSTLTQLKRLEIRWNRAACDASLEGSVDEQTWLPLAFLPQQAATRSVDGVAQYFRLSFGSCAGGAPVAVRKVRLEYQTPSLADQVNIFIGTNNEGPALSRGNQYPGVYTPFGMAAWSIGTQSLQSSWFYDYKDPNITGIKLTHQTTVWGSDFAAIDLMPLTGELIPDYTQRASPYQRANEIARPYYYRNTLDRYGITFEFSPSDRGAIFRFRYPTGVAPELVFNGDGAGTSRVTQQGANAIIGNITNGGVELFFRAEFDRPIASLSTGADRVLGLQFSQGPPGSANTVVMKLASSYISADQAGDNLTLELSGHTLESLAAESKAKWEQKLSQIRVRGGRAADQMTFYSALYRVFGFPKMHWEPVGQDASRSQYSSPFDNQVHLDRKFWNGNGFWDTHRTVWPLFTLLFPEMTGQMLDGWVNSYKDGGWTVRWSKPGYWDSMIGTSTDILFADAFVKGIRNWDYLTGYRASVKNAMVPGSLPGTGRRFLQRSAFLGYIPSGGKLGADQSGSRTMEDAVDDFGISVFAKALGKDDESRYFRNRALGYTKLWDPQSRFFREKDDQGNWVSEGAFDPFVWGYAWTEGNLWHYRFAPAHDGAGLIALFGGRAGLEQALDELMTADPHFGVGSYGTEIHEMTEAQLVGKQGFGQFAINNEPVEHFLQMYAWAGRPSKTQYWARRAVTELHQSGYGNGYGYPGDEDEGQLSAWYAMNAIGIYPAAPGFPEYVMGSPIFDTVTIHPEGGRDFVISTSGNDADHVYIQQARLNGQPYGLSYLRHQDITGGGVLELVMGAQPSHWAESEASMPSSLTRLGDTPQFTPSLTAGATVTGSGENAPSETLANLVDSDSTTKWLTFASTGYFQVHLAQPAAASCYTMTSAADEPGRDPRSWQVYGVDGSSRQLLDERKGESWSDRLQTRLFCFANRSPFADYRIEISENAGAAQLQVAEFELR